MAYFLVPGIEVGMGPFFAWDVQVGQGLFQELYCSYNKAICRPAGSGPSLGVFVLKTVYQSGLVIRPGRPPFISGVNTSRANPGKYHL